MNMAGSNERKIIIGVQRPGAVDNIDIGPLISEFTVEPWELVQDISDGYHPDGQLEISVERTHEWEYLIVLGLAGGATFATAAIQALGNRFGEWIADQASGSSRRPDEISISTESGTSVNLPVDKISESTDEITLVLEEGSESQEKVTIEM